MTPSPWLLNQRRYEREARHARFRAAATRIVALVAGCAVAGGVVVVILQMIGVLPV